MTAVKTGDVVQKQTVVGRVGGTLGGIAIAQSQGYGVAATIACGAGGYFIGAVVDGYLNSDSVYQVKA